MHRLQAMAADQSDHCLNWGRDRRQTLWYLHFSPPITPLRPLRESSLFWPSQLTFSDDLKQATDSPSPPKKHASGHRPNSPPDQAENATAPLRLCARISGWGGLPQRSQRAQMGICRDQRMDPTHPHGEVENATAPSAGGSDRSLNPAAESRRCGRRPRRDRPGSAAARSPWGRRSSVRPWSARDASRTSPRSAAKG